MQVRWIAHSRDPFLIVWWFNPTYEDIIKNQHFGASMPISDALRKATHLSCLHLGWWLTSRATEALALWQPPRCTRPLGRGGFNPGQPLNLCFGYLNPQFTSEIGKDGTTGTTVFWRVEFQGGPHFQQSRSWISEDAAPVMAATQEVVAGLFVLRPDGYWISFVQKKRKVSSSLMAHRGLHSTGETHRELALTSADYSIFPVLRARTHQAASGFVWTYATRIPSWLPWLPIIPVRWVEHGRNAWPLSR